MRSVEFYKRTYITDGLKDLLSILRNDLIICGDPVIELQTNFGEVNTFQSSCSIYVQIILDKLPELMNFVVRFGINNIPRPLEQY